MPYITNYPSPTHVHASDLTEMAISPAHYHERVTTPAEKRKDTKPLLVGRVLHAKVLGFGSWAVFDGSRNSNAFKAFKLEHESDDIITPEENEKTDRMAAKIRSTKDAIDLLKGCELESEFEWLNVGRKCAGRVDAFARNRLIDIKTSRCAKPGRFERDARNLGYHAKLSWYRDGLISLDRLDADAQSYLIVVESKAPYEVVVYRAKPAFMLAGEMLYRSWLEKLLVCEHTNEWPGYAQSIVDLDLPDDGQAVDYSGLEDVEDAA